jgi:hypothetical protein
MGFLKRIAEKIGLFLKKLWFFCKRLGEVRIVMKNNSKQDEIKLSKKANDVLSRMKIENCYSGDKFLPYEKYFHLPAEISKTHFQNFYRPLRDSSEGYLDKVGEIGRKVIKGLFKIEGIEDVSIYPYKMAIRIGHSFTWDDIIPEVKKMIKRVF